MTVPPPVVMVVCSPNVLPSKRGFHPGRRGNSSRLFNSLHLIRTVEKGAWKYFPHVFGFMCCLCGLPRDRVFVNEPCVPVCVPASMQADVSSEVSEHRAVGPHGLSEADRISISLAEGLYSCERKSVCVCVYAWGSLCGDHQHLLDGQHNVLPKHES